MNRKCILHVLLLCSSLQLHSIFDSIPELMSYAKHHIEDPEIDNTNWERPDFTSFYTNQLPSFMSRVKSFFSFKQAGLDIPAFKEMIQTVTKRRKELGLSGSFISKIELIDQGRLVVFGNRRRCAVIGRQRPALATTPALELVPAPAPRRRRLVCRLCLAKAARAAGRRGPDERDQIGSHFELVRIWRLELRANEPRRHRGEEQRCAAQENGIPHEIDPVSKLRSF